MVVRINRVTTRTGDGGETGLGDGSRLPKDAARIEALGAVDEANAVLGLLCLALEEPACAAVRRVQNDLFDLGADLAVPGQAADRLRISDDQVAWLEAGTEALNADLPPLTSFVLPGGTAAAAAAHHARTVVRRAERRVVTLARETPINPVLLRYLNRLSDYLFVLARATNRGAGDVLWAPGAGR